MTKVKKVIVREDLQDALDNADDRIDNLLEELGEKNALLLKQDNELTLLQRKLQAVIGSMS